MASGARSKRVCIYGELVADALEGNVIGGAELQAALLARALAASGWSVAVADPKARIDAVTEEGIAVRTIPGWYRGIRGLRVVTHRIPALVRLGRSVKPSVYYCRGYSFVFLFLLLIARLTGSLFVLAIASDLDVAGFRRRYRSFYNRSASPWEWVSTILPNHLTAGIILRFADVVLYQHPGQEKLLRGRPGVLLANIVSDELFRVSPAPVRDHVLLVGLLAVQKGLREFLPVIRDLPETTFEFVGAPSGRDGGDIEQQLRACPNVVLHGQLRREETLRMIASARVLLNVSPAEGFPNTFLEAWALGTPVLSLTVDPDGVIARHGLGVVCGGDMNKLVSVLRSGSFATDPERLAGYVREHHSMAAAARIFTDAVTEAAGKPGRGKEAMAS